MNKNGKTNGAGSRRPSIDGFVQQRAPRPVVRRPVYLSATRQTLQPQQPSVPQQTSAPQPVIEPVEPEQMPTEAVLETSAEPAYYPLPAYRAPEHPIRPLKKRLSRVMLVLRCASIVFAAFLLTGGFLMWRGYSNVHKVFRGTETVAALKETKVAPELLKGEGDGRVNIVLLGVGGPGHDGADLTDTIVVLSVDPVNKTAAMLSVPRDLWVKMPNNYISNYQKINAAYESGKYQTLGKVDASNASQQALQAGFDAVDSTLKTVLDIPISYNVLVNFQAFRQAVDTVGGVTVNVPTALVDPTMAWENHNDPILAQAGVQQMDGVHALIYARSRETTSDFARAERQRQILIALKDKVMTAGTLSNPAKIDGLLSAFGNNVYSDLSTTAAMRLMGILKDVGDNNITSLSLADDKAKLVTTDHVGNISVVRPVAGFNNYTAIQDYVHQKLLDGYLVKEHAGVAVVGATAVGSSGVAALLTTYGYTVTSTGTTNETITNPVVVDLSKGKSPYTKHYLEKRFGVNALTSLPTGVTITDPTAQFVIITNK